MLLSVTLGRDDLELEPLVITNGPGPLRITQDATMWPTFTMRLTHAPQSEGVGGDQLEAKVPNQGTFALGISAHGDDVADVEAAKDELTAATTQFSYPVTLALNGVEIGTWNADPVFPNWGSLDFGDVAANICKGTVTIPINPAVG